MVMTLNGAAVRTIFVEVPGTIADEALVEVTIVLNERLSGLTLDQVRTSLASRLRDVHTRPETAELLNIFVQEGDQVFALAAEPQEAVLIGQPSLLADQPEFASGERLRQLIELTERRQQLASCCKRARIVREHHHRQRAR